MDDTFTALPKDLVDPFLDQRNGIELSINFTVEKENTDGWCSWMCSYAGKMIAQGVLLSTAS